MSALLEQMVDNKMVLAKAVLNAAKQLDLKQTQLAGILGVHRTFISRLKRNPELDPASQQGELAILLIRIFKALYVLADGDVAYICHFMNTPNRVTGGIPVQQMESISGLLNVLNFVEAIRQKV